MYKDELIHLHQLLIYLMKFLIDNGVSKSFFEEYTNLGISPHHIHRTKAEHKYAIFVLASGISNVLAENNEIIPRSVANRLGELAKRCKSEIIRQRKR
ncbi:MAG: UPF0058 family protein [Euryarchaeota archaeon]|nr:UPF0058 family protein [Euryarchaeota archaeon]